MRTWRIHACLTVAAILTRVTTLTDGGPTVTVASGTALEPRGAAAMAAFDRLPYFKDETTVHQVSSFDRSGANDDGNHRYQYVNTSTGDYVVLDEARPGTIYRIWATGLAGGRIRMYFDQEQTPRVDLPVDDFFSVGSSPWPFPLAGGDYVSSGAYYCYYPFSFEESARVEFTSVPEYYQITYHLYSTADGVTTYSGNEDLASVLDAWTHPRLDPKEMAHNRTVIWGPSELAPGQAATLLDTMSSGSLRSFILSLPQLSARAHDPATVDILSNTWVQMYWDGEGAPSVDVPIGFLFGLGSAGLGRAEAVLMGADPTTRTFYNYFPMPYSQSARVCLVNRSAVTISGASVELQYSTIPYEALGADAGYFTAVYRSERLTTDGEDYVLLDVPRGRGHVVGLVLTVAPDYSGGGLAVLEGDERVFVDTREFDPQIHGTGTEDFFNAGWYFKWGTFTLPVHGNPVGGQPVADPPRITMYRLSLADAFPFQRSILFSLEHGRVNDLNAEYESVVFAYLGRDDVSLFESDVLDLSDEMSRAGHGYETSGCTVTLDSTFVGRDQEATRRFSGQGTAHLGTSSFTLSLWPANYGVRLARILDQSSGNQRANVYVDETLAGTWFTGGRNVYHRAAYDFFELPRALTRDKSSIRVRVEFLDGDPQWNEFVYYAYSHVYGQPSIPTQTSTPAPSRPLTATPTATQTTSPTVTTTPTATGLSVPLLLHPEDGGRLPQPVLPGEWLFEWQACGYPCECYVVIAGPGGRLISSSAIAAPESGPYEYRYRTSSYLAQDALGPWYWHVRACLDTQCSISAQRSFWVERARLVYLPVVLR